MQRIATLLLLLIPLLFSTGNAQSNHVSLFATYNHSGSFIGIGYEHVFSNYFSVGGELGYFWGEDLIVGNRGGAFSRNQVLFQVSPKYYFLLRERYLGEGVYVALPVNYSCIWTQHNPIPRSVARKIAGGVGIGANLFFSPRFFAGGDVGIQYYSGRSEAVYPSGLVVQLPPQDQFFIFTSFKVGLTL